MGLLTKLNPVKLIRDGFESVTGIDDQRRAINAASAAQRESIFQAIQDFEGAGQSAANFLTLGTDRARDIITGGGAFNPQEFGQGLTLEGFGTQLSDIASPTGVFAPLIQDRQLAATQALSSAGLTRSGNAAEAAAAIPLEVALGISDKLFGRQAGVANNLANLEQNLQGNLANLELSQAGNIANLRTGAGQVEAQRIADQASIANPFSSLLSGAISSAVGPALGQAAGAAGGALSSGIGALLGLFSDERLKENMKIIGRDGPFTFYEWDWLPEIQELDLVMMNVGLIAQDVEEIAPEYVFQVGEIKAINYDALLKDERWLTSSPQ